MPTKSLESKLIELEDAYKRELGERKDLAVLFGHEHLAINRN